MNDDDLRRELERWDPASGRPDAPAETPARVRQRLDGAEAPGWTSGRAGDRWSGRAIRRLRDLLGAPAWRPLAAVTVATVAIAVALFLVRGTGTVRDLPAPDETANAHADAETTAGEEMKMVYTAANGVRVYWSFRRGDSAPGI